MTQHKDPESLQVMIVRDLARTYRSFLHPRRNHRTNEQSNLKKIFSEQVEPARRHPHTLDNTGFS